MASDFFVAAEQAALRRCSDDARWELLGTRLRDNESKKRHQVTGWIVELVTAGTMRASVVACGARVPASLHSWVLRCVKAVAKAVFGAVKKYNLQPTNDPDREPSGPTSGH